MTSDLTEGAANGVAAEAHGAEPTGDSQDLHQARASSPHAQVFAEKMRMVRLSYFHICFARTMQ